MASLNYSRQRESIKSFLVNRTDHPTADTIYVNLRQEYPNISLGTVYRNLKLLTELGEIRKISSGDGHDRFDCNLVPHQHFICRRCHRVSDLNLEGLNDLKALAQTDFHGRIDDCSVLFHGICESCLKEESAQNCNQ